MMTALFSALVGSVARGGRAALPSVGSLRVAVAPYMIDTFPYTGSVRPGKQSPMRKIPSTILRPDYADDGRPKAKGSLLPWQVEVKTAEDIAGMRIAGRVAREVLDAAGRMVAPGMTTDAIDELVTRETIARGAYPSPLNYHNFPKSCCTSINEVICHGIPDSTVLKDGDIVNIDITCYIGGYHGDCSETFLVGNVDEAGRQLVKVTHDCWQAAIEYCKPGQPFSGIGKIIEDFVKPCVARTECPTADAQDAPPTLIVPHTSRRPQVRLLIQPRLLWTRHWKSLSHEPQHPSCAQQRARSDAGRQCVHDRADDLRGHLAARDVERSVDGHHVSTPRRLIPRRERKQIRLQPDDSSNMFRVRVRGCAGVTADGRHSSSIRS